MAIKRIIGRWQKKHRKCLCCGTEIDKELQDNVVYICGYCGQRHFVDVYEKTIVLTVIERPDVRYRPAPESVTEGSKAGRKLVAKVDARRLEADVWEETYKDWLEELAEMPEQEREADLKLMGEEMLGRVLRYLEKRNIK